MKKLLTLLLFFTLFLAYGQVSPFKTVRVANATTTFSENLSVGTLVYNVDTDELFQANAAVVSTLTLTTGTALFTLIDSGGTDDQDLSYNSGTHAIDITDGSSATVPLAVADGATEGLASFTAVDFDATTGNISLDYTNAQKATTSTIGFLTDTDWDTFNDKGNGDMVLADVQSVTGLKTFDKEKLAMKGTSTGVNLISVANTSGTDYTNIIPAKAGTFAMTSDITGTNSGTNTGDQDLTYNSGTHTVELSAGDDAIIPLSLADGATEGLASFASADFTATAGNIVIANDGVTYAQMQNVVADERILGRVSGADGIVEELTAAQVLTMINVEANADVNFTFLTEKFEEDDGTPTAHSLAQTAQTAGATVSINGAMLDPADYTLASSTITVTVPVLQYDIVIISYLY